MSFDPPDNPRRSQGASGRTPPGAQGASRGGRRPDETADFDDADGRAHGFRDDQSTGYREQRARTGQAGSGGKKFLGLPVALIYAIGAIVIGLIFIGAVCSPSTTTGSVAGQVKSLAADRTVNTLAGAQVILRGSNQTYTTVSTDVDPNAEGEAAYNYRFENVPPGTYTMAVTPPAGSGLQPESDVTLKVESGELFPQSIMLLAEGIQKPRALAPSELQPGQAGYINDRGERVVYQQGGFDASDALLMYLLWRNPPAWGYGAPPIIVNNPGGTRSSTGSNYRVSDPPSQSRSGQSVTQQRPSVPGQGTTRPSSSTGATGSGPSRSGSGTSDDTAAPSKPSTGTGASTGTGTGTGTSSSGSGSTTTTTRPSQPSQGVSRPSSSGTSSRPSGSTSRPSSSGGRR